MPKIFLTTLGTGNYEATQYRFPDEKRTVLPKVKDIYVQQATVEYCCRDWKEEDKVLVLLTDSARAKHWEGLSQKLQKLKLNCVVNNVSILDSNSSDELWSLYTCILDAVPKNSELYLDITHGFRAFPFVINNFLQYLKAVKNVQINWIGYGLYEKGLEINDIVELTEFDRMIDYANAVNNFKNLGDARDFNKLIEAELKPLGDKRVFGNVFILWEKIGRNLANFTEALNVCSQKDLLQALDNLDNHLSKLEEHPKDKIFKPLVDVINLEIKSFSILEEKPVLRLLSLAIWLCSKNNFQQAITIAESCIGDFIFELTDLTKNPLFEDQLENFSDNKRNRFKADLVSHSLIMSNSDNKTSSDNKFEFRNKLLAESPFKEVLLSVTKILSSNKDFILNYDQLKKIRNSINHFSDEHNTKDSIKGINTLVDKLSENIKQFSYIEARIDLSQY